MLWGVTVNQRTGSPEHQHAPYEMIVSKGSGGRLLIGGAVYDFRPGRTFFIPSGKPHAIEAGIDQPIKALVICVDTITLKQLIPQTSYTLMSQTLDAQLTSLEPPTHVDEVLDISDKIDQAIRSTSIYSEAMFSSLFTQLIVLHCMACTVDAPNQQPGHHIRINEIRNWVDEHYAAPITLDQMAAKAAMSRSVFSRLFKRYIGMSLIDYCMQARVAAAARLAGKTETPITAIALQVGFSNLSHFHRVFKRRYGMAPGEYRKFLRSQGVPVPKP